ncbi:MAG: hypothetical protein AB7N65_10990 [Vicinamibacterales bacterium]
MRVRLLLCTVAIATLVAGSVSRAQRTGDPNPVLNRIVDHLTEYYARAQSLVGREEVTRQPIRVDFSFEGPPTRYTYRLRLDWIPPELDESPKATMMRELLTVNGRRPKPKDKPKCSQPKETWDEPLAMFLREEREKYHFKWAGSGRMDGRATVSLDFRERSEKKPADPETSWDKSDDEACVSFSLPGRMYGRVWVDIQTGEVLRLDENVSGPVDIKVPREQQKHWHTTSLTLDRWNRSIRYKQVRFDDPPETIMLPESIQVLSIMRGGAQPMRVTQRFTDYRRFLTGGRLVE